MSISEKEIKHLNVYEQESKNLIMQEVINDEIVQKTKGIQSIIDSKNMIWNSENSHLTPSLLSIYNIENFNSIHHNVAYELNNKIKYNSSILLAPNSDAFVDAILSDEDILLGYNLEYNPNQVLWRVNAAGIAHPEDLDKYEKQRVVIKSSIKLTINETKKILESKSLDIKQMHVNTDELFLANGLKPGQGNLVQLSANSANGEFNFKNYNRKAVVAYAINHYNSRNNDFPNFADNDEGDGGYDCTNFASQCANAGGIPMSPRWYCLKGASESLKTHVCSSSWDTVNGFANYMVSAGYAYISYDSRIVQPGDFIQFYREEDGGWHHTGVVTKVESGQIFYTARSNSVADRDLSKVYPSEQTEVRFICVYNPWEEI